MMAVQASEVVIKLACFLAGGLLCAFARPLARAEKRFFPLTSSLPIWVLITRSWVIGLGLIAGGISYHSSAIKALFRSDRACPASGFGWFVLIFSLSILVFGIIVRSLGKRQREMPQHDSLPVPQRPGVKVVRAPEIPAETRRDQETGAIFILVAMALLALFGLLEGLGVLCWIDALL